MKSNSTAILIKIKLRHSLGRPSRSDFVQAAFDEVSVKKLPKVKKLSIEYAEVLTAKKQTYAEYRQGKNEAQELLIAQRNIASLYDAERKEEEQKRLKENQIH